MSYQQKARLLDKTVVVDTSEDVFHVYSGQEFYTFLLKCIPQLTGSVLFRYYSVQADTIGKTIAYELIKRKLACMDRDIPLAIDFLYDHLPIDKPIGYAKRGARRLAKEMFANLQKFGIPVRQIKGWHDKSVRDHRKQFVWPEGGIGAFGSCNLTLHDYEWEQIMVVFTHQALVRMLWDHAILERPGRMTPIVYRDYPDITDYFLTDGIGNGNQVTLPAVEDLLMHTKGNDEITLAAPYLGSCILEKLFDTKRRTPGLRINVVFPEENNSQMYQKMHNSYAPWLTSEGINVYFYNGMFHMKLARIGERVLVTSNNFCKKKLGAGKNLEAGMLTSHPTLIQMVNPFFEKLFVNSTLIDPSGNRVELSA